MGHGQSSSARLVGGGGRGMPGARRRRGVAARLAGRWALVDGGWGPAGGDGWCYGVSSVSTGAAGGATEPNSGVGCEGRRIETIMH